MNRIIILLLICLANIAYSQNTKTEKNLNIVISSGTAINDPINYYFFKETDDKIINPGFTGSLGIEYGPLDIIELAQLYLSISVGYTYVSTSEFQLENYPSSAELIIETYPILFWWKIQTNTRLSPFVEIGLGYSKLNFVEKYSNLRLNGTSFSYWAFAYGFGAGLNYKISQKFNLALVIHELSNEKDKIVENGLNHKSGIAIRNVVTPLSLRLSLKI